MAGKISFDFFQRIGRSMMAVVLILPLVSILMGLGGVLLNPSVHELVPFLSGQRMASNRRTHAAGGSGCF